MGCAGFSLRWFLLLQSAGSRGVGFKSCGLSCPTICGILVPRSGMEPMSPALAGGFLTTGPPGKSSQVLFKVADLICILTSRAVCERMMTVCMIEWMQVTATPWAGALACPLVSGLQIAHPVAAAQSRLGCGRFETLCDPRWQCGTAAKRWENLDSGWEPDSTSLCVRPVTSPRWAWWPHSWREESCGTGQGSSYRPPRSQGVASRAWLLVFFCAWTPSQSSAFI